MNHSVAATIRKLTLAPLLAAVMLIYLYIVQPLIFGSVEMLIQQLALLSLFPILAYPVQPLLRTFREKGREGQRHLAMIFAFIGYLQDCILNITGYASGELCMIGWVYLLSGVLILVLNRIFHLRASGHGAGIGAAMCLPVALGYPETLLISIPLLCLVCWSSLETKRHTLPQLFGGTLIPAALTLLFMMIR